MSSSPGFRSRTDFSGFIGMKIADGDLQLVEHLGQGAYGVVFRAIDKKDTSPEPKQFAVKIMEKAQPHTRAWRFQQRELRAHGEVSGHPNICELHGYYETDELFYIVLEYCPGGDLLHALVERRLYARNDELVKSVFVQLLDAVAHCHANGVYHRDLKPDNVLVNEDGSQIRLADFGLATTTKVSDNFGCGSSTYMSPECIGQEIGYEPYSTEASDVWSLGVILCNIVAGSNPWAIAMTSDKLFKQYLENPGFLRETMPISIACENILDAIFEPYPADRITIPELRKLILEVDTFFMSPEDIAKGDDYLKRAAAAYKPRLPPLEPPAEAIRCQSVLWAEDAVAILAQVSDTRVRSAIMNMRFEDENGNFVIAPSAGISPSSSESSSSTSSTESPYCSCSSGEDSGGPCTPETHAQNPVQLAEIPDFPSNEKIGKAFMANPARKGNSLPLPTRRAPVAIVVPAA
ncbi:kinase-like domain-containing protein [Cerioporus squamosus]|nr:kinase-like domain-containing protein [Cerioporus squamosus]